MQDLIAKTCNTMYDLLQNFLKWSQDKDSIWVTKTTLFKLAGQSYKKFDDHGKYLFWNHLRALSVTKCLPKFTTRNVAGKPLCFHSAFNLFSDIWCEKCSKLDDLMNKCDECLSVVRFLKLKPGIKLSLYKTLKSRPVLLKPTVVRIQKEILTFKGFNFTKHLLPRVLGTTISEDCFIPLKYQKVLHNSALTPIVKINQLLDFIYPILKTDIIKLTSVTTDVLQINQDVILPETNVDQSRVWIAPVRECNAQISLSNKIHLTEKNSVGVRFGKYHVWGFNAADVHKWHILQPNDYVVFGNTRHGLLRFGTVCGKFVWKAGESSCTFSYENNEKPWLYGFTVDIVTSIKWNMTGKILRALIGVHQTQSMLTPENSKKILDFLHAN